MFTPLLLRMQAGLLESEFDKLTPAISETLASVNSQITQGFSPEQIALGAIGLPIAYQVIKIAAGYAQTHQDGIQRRREREDREHAAKLDREMELFKAKLRVGLDPTPNAQAPLPPAQ